MGQTIIGFLIEPRGLLWLDPRDDVIPLAQPFPLSEVGLAVLMPPRHELDARFPQQGEHEPPAVVPVGQHQIATLEFVEQRAEERRLAGLLARIRPVARARTIPVASEVNATTAKCTLECISTRSSPNAKWHVKGC